MGTSKELLLAEATQRGCLALGLEKDHRLWAPQVSGSWALVPGKLGGSGFHWVVHPEGQTLRTAFSVLTKKLGLQLFQGHGKAGPSKELWTLGQQASLVGARVSVRLCM